MTSEPPKSVVVQTPRTDALYKAVGARMSSLTEATHDYSRNQFAFNPEHVIEHASILSFFVTGLTVGAIALITGRYSIAYSVGTGVFFCLSFVVSYVALMLVAIRANETERIAVYFDYASESDGNTGETPEVKIQVTQGNNIIYDTLPLSGSQLILMANHLASGGRVSRNQFVTAGIIHKNGYSELFNALLMSGYLIQDGQANKATAKLKKLVSEIATVNLGN